MAISTTDNSSLVMLQNLISQFVSILDGEAAIPSVDRQLTADNITQINVLIADMLTQMDGIINVA